MKHDAAIYEVQGILGASERSVFDKAVKVFENRRTALQPGISVALAAMGGAPIDKLPMQDMANALKQLDQCAATLLVPS